MIALLLLIAAMIITFLDISHYWLDDETKNILYFGEWVKFTKTLQTFCAAPLTKPAVGFTL